MLEARNSMVRTGRSQELLDRTAIRAGRTSIVVRRSRDTLTNADLVFIRSRHVLFGGHENGETNA